MKALQATNGCNGSALLLNHREHLIHLHRKTTGTNYLWPTPFRRSPSDHSGAEEHERGEDERCAWRFGRPAGGRIRSDKVGKGLSEESRSYHAGHSVDAGDGALKLALFGTADTACHEGLRRWTGEPPERHHRNTEAEDPALRCNAVDEKTDRSAQ